MEIIGKTSGGMGMPGQFSPGEHWIIEILGRTVHVPTSIPESQLEAAALQRATGLDETEVSSYMAARERVNTIEDFTPTESLVADLVTIIKVLQR